MIPCDQCDYKTKTTVCLDKHTQTLHRNKKIICRECGFQTLYQQSLTVHQQSLHEGKQYPCDYQATIKGKLTNHKQ